MRLARKLVVTVALIAVAASIVAPSAFASEPVESLQPNLEHCPSLDAGGCARHLVGEATFRTHFFGVEAQEARCRIELEGASDESGHGRIDTAETTNGGHGEGNCPSVSPPCPGSLPWPTSTEEIAANTVEDHVDVCIDPGEFLTCEGEFDTHGVEEGGGTPDEGQHATATDNRIGTSFCEFDFEGETESAKHGVIHTRHI